MVRARPLGKVEKGVYEQPMGVQETQLIYRPFSQSKISDDPKEAKRRSNEVVEARSESVEPGFGWRFRTGESWRVATTSDGPFG